MTKPTGVIHVVALGVLLVGAGCEEGCPNGYAMHGGVCVSARAGEGGAGAGMAGAGGAGAAGASSGAGSAGAGGMGAASGAGAASAGTGEA